MIKSFLSFAGAAALSLGAMSVTASGAASAAPAPLPLPLEIDSISMTAVVASLVAEAVTAEDAWNRGDLDARKVMNLFTSAVVNGDKNRPLRVQLMRTLLRHHPDILPQKPQEVAVLGQSLLIAMADYYADSHDIRAIDIYEKLINEESRRNEKCLLLLQLAGFYVGTGQPQLAIDTYLRIPPLVQDTDPEVMASLAAEAYVYAARHTLWMGDKEKARTIYGEMAKWQGKGNAWPASIAAWDQGILLVANGQQDEARRLLGTPIQGPGADLAGVCPMLLLGRSYYRTGEFGLARKYTEQALAQYQTVRNPLQGQGIQEQVENGWQRLNLINQWVKNPLMCYPDQISLVADPTGKPSLRRILIRAVKPNELRISSTNPLLEIGAPGPWEDCGDYFQTKVILRIPASALKQNTEAAVSVAVEGQPDSRTLIPVRATKADQIHMSRSALFFGALQAGETLRKKVVLSANTPFRVTSFQADSDSILVTGPISAGAAKTGEVEFTFSAKTIGYQEGRVRIDIETPGADLKEALTISYAAYVK